MSSKVTPIKNVVVKRMARPQEALVEGFKGLPVANIADAIGKPSYQTMSTCIRPPFEDVHLAGPAVTVKEQPGCNLMTHKACDLAQEGDVIVVDAGGYTKVAVGGFLMARKLVSKGVAGVVVDGAWRDRAEIRRARFPVFSRAWQATGPHKDQPGSVNVPIACGGVLVRAGDIVIGDDDSVIVVPLEYAGDVLERALEIRSGEAERIGETRKEDLELPNPLASDERLRGLGVEIR